MSSYILEVICVACHWRYKKSEDCPTAYDNITDSH